MDRGSTWEEMLKNVAREVLCQQGVPEKLKGFMELEEAIVEVAQHPEKGWNVTAPDGLYNEIAKRNEKKYGAVRNTMSEAIRKATTRTFALQLALFVQAAAGEVRKRMHM